VAPTPPIESRPAGRARALAKAVSWRIVGSLDTFGLSLIVTGNPAWAGTIASVEALTKIALFYFHERAWTRTGWGLSGGQHARAVVKGLSWRALATLDTFGLSWLVTGHLASAAGIATLETFTKVGLFYLHEQAWLRVERVLRGRAPAPAAGTQTLERAKEPHAAGGADSRGADARAGAG
jgi:uncharacterized membrane protein